MKILITGAFGNLGKNLLKNLRNTKHEITCFVRNTRKSKRYAKSNAKNVKVFYGDIRNKEDIAQAVKDQEMVIHLAAIVPPKFNKINPDYTREVNVLGTFNLIETLNTQSNPAKILYTSSVAVFGDVRARGACIIAPDEMVNPNEDDIYAQQKAESEKLLMNSKLIWSIFRFGFIVNLGNLKMDPMMFDVPLDTNMEIIHIKDAALALTNAIEREEIWGNILHLAGGNNCRITYKEFMTGMLTTMGLASLPDDAFGTNDFHCAYFDTEYSQKLLKYQNHSFEDLLAELKKKSKLTIFFARLFRSIARSFLLSKSPYYKKKKTK
ncbi:MAG: NAD(P)-dependent oxidoreductase [Candidatus Heimdallarchaeota archaeon]|nr:NAD(P)-dependent oxidoreductase [Candidatus Heimdallarchaeota archaeon]